MKLANKKLHFIGIGGAGMSGLARIALTHSAVVSGSDEKDSSVYTEHIQNFKTNIYYNIIILILLYI